MGVPLFDESIRLWWTSSSTKCPIFHKPAARQLILEIYIHSVGIKVSWGVRMTERQAVRWMEAPRAGGRNASTPHPGGAPLPWAGLSLALWCLEGQIFGGAAGGFPAGWRAYRLVGEGAP